MPFAVLMLIAGTIVVKRGLVKLPYPPEGWKLIVGTCLVAYSFRAGVSFFWGSLLLLVAGPVFALFALPLGFFASGAIAVVFAAGAIRIVTFADTRYRIWPWTLGVGLGVALLGVALTGMDWRNLNVSHLNSLLVVEPVLGGIMGHWLTLKGNTPTDVNETEKQ